MCSVYEAVYNVIKYTFIFLQFNQKTNNLNKKMDKRLEQMFLWRRYTNGQLAHEKMLNITKH